MIPLEKSDYENEELVFFILDNIFSELMEGEKFYHVEDGNFVFYIFNVLPDREKEWRQKVLINAEFVRKVLNEKFETAIVGAVSDFTEDKYLIKSLYHSVISAFEYGNLIGGNGILDVREMPGYNAFHVFEEHMSKEFREAFLLNDVKRALAVSDKLFTSFHGSSKVIVKVRVYETFIIMMDIFKEYVNDIEYVVQKNKIDVIISKINVIMNLKEKIKFNINNNLLMDKLLIELEGCEQDD